jgi:hypothetical protein
LQEQAAEDELAAFDEASGEWIVHPGRYELLVGRSSRDLRARAGFEVARSPVRSKARAVVAVDPEGSAAGWCSGDSTASASS